MDRLEILSALPWQVVPLATVPANTREILRKVIVDLVTFPGRSKCLGVKPCSVDVKPPCGSRPAVWWDFEAW